MLLATMASSKLKFTLILVVCMVMAAAYATPSKAEEGAVKKHPEWFYDSHDGSFLIPGLGRYIMPSGGGFPSITGGDTGGAGSSTAAPRQYIPGGDDTFVPNPAFESPNPVP